MDTETTGFGRTRRDAIVQIGLAYRDPRTGGVVAWGERCNPGEEFLRDGRAAEALALCGVREQDVLSARPAVEVAKSFFAALEEARVRFGPWVVSTYNVAFDRPFLEAAPWRFAGPWGPCVMLEAHRRLDPHGKWPKLEEACRRLGIDPSGGRAHDAVEDAVRALHVSERLGTADARAHGDPRGGWPTSRPAR